MASQSDFYADDYERAGPRARPIIRRSAYLAEALRSLQQSSQDIKGGWGDLGARLMAQALLEWKRGKTEKDLEGARQADFANDPRVLAWEAMTGRGAPAIGDGSPTSTAPGLSTPPPAASPMNAPAEKVADRLTLPQARGTDNAGEMDMMARLLMAEAPPQGQQAVAAVINNRSQRDNKSLTDVMTARHQFEPMGTAAGRARMAAIDPNSPQYGGAMEAAKRGQFDVDPTGGAGNFYSPAAQSALGRPPPQWAQGQQGQNIGGNHYFNLSNEAPLPPPPVLQRPPAQQTQQPQPPSAGSPSPAGAPPAAPVANQGTAGGVPQGPQARGANAITPAQRAYIDSLIANPATRQQGVAMATQAMQQMNAPIQWKQVTIGGVPHFYDEQNPGQLYAGTVPQSAMSQTQTPEQAGIAAPPGTVFSRSPLNEVKPIYQPPAGQQVTSAPGQPYRESAVPGSQRDPTSQENIIRNEGELRQRYDADMRDYQAARNGFLKVQAAARDSSPTSDIALIFGFMKTLDPTSTVREGEFATAQNSGSVGDSIANLYNRVISGERLQPHQREQFARTAAQQFQVYQQQADQTNARYEGLARSYGFDPSRIIQRYGPATASPAAPPPGQSPSPAPTGRNGAPRAGAGASPNRARRLY